MTHETFRRALETLGINRNWLAAQVGRNPTAVRDWQTGRCAVPPAVADWIQRRLADPPPRLDPYRPTPPQKKS